MYSKRIPALINLSIRSFVLYDIKKSLERRVCCLSDSEPNVENVLVILRCVWFFFLFFFRSVCKQFFYFFTRNHCSNNNKNQKNGQQSLSVAFSNRIGAMFTERPQKPFFPLHTIMFQFIDCSFWFQYSENEVVWPFTNNFFFYFF